MNTPNEQALLETLLHVARHVYSGTVDKSMGICELVEIYLHHYLNLGYRKRREVKGLLYELFLIWPKYSGNGHYPIPAAKGQHVNEVFNVARMYSMMWDTDTQYGKDRIELLDFMIKELQNAHT